MIQVALVGCAHIHTPGFVKRLQARHDVTVKYIWDHQAKRAEKWTADLNAAVVDDLSEIWADKDVQAVIICAETDRHQPLVKAAAAAKKHLFVEKPLGLGAADAHTMADAIEDAGVIFQTGYFQRGNPIHLFIKEQIEKGHFGRITRLRMSNCHSGALGDWFTPDWLWMTDVQQAGVGAYGDLGTHSLDIMLWMLGNISNVAATLGSATARYGEACDEFGEGLFKFENGAIGTLAASWVDVADPVTLQIAGTEGHAHVSNGQLYFQSEHIEGADGQEPWRDLPPAWPHAFEIFLDATVGKTHPPLVGAREAAIRSDVMEAIYRAAATQTWQSPSAS